MGSTNLSAALFKNVLDALPDGILIVAESRRMVYTNNRFHEMWDIPTQHYIDDEGPAIMKYALSQVADPELFVQVVEMLHRNDNDYEDEIKLRDGRTFKRRSVSFRDADLGRSRIWIFTDVTAIVHSQLDMLTGLLNRNKFERNFPSFCAEATPQSLVGVALLDIDQFKNFNDTYGHHAGDEVLRKIGAVIRNHLQRSTDIAYRIGGEEFFIQYGGRSHEEVAGLINNLRRDVEALDIPHVTNPPFNRVTISCGFGICASPRPSDIIYRKVDGALYQSKSNGRNQVTYVDLDFVQETTEHADEDSHACVSSPAQRTASRGD